MGYKFLVLLCTLMLCLNFTNAERRQKHSIVEIIFKGFEIVPNVVDTVPKMILNTTFGDNMVNTTLKYLEESQVQDAPIVYFRKAKKYSLVVMTFNSDFSKQKATYILYRFPSYLLYTQKGMARYQQMNHDGDLPYETSSEFDDGYLYGIFLFEHPMDSESQPPDVSDRTKFSVQDFMQNNNLELIAGNALKIYR